MLRDETRGQEAHSEIERDHSLNRSSGDRKRAEGTHRLSPSSQNTAVKRGLVGLIYRYVLKTRRGKFLSQGHPARGDRARIQSQPVPFQMSHTLARQGRSPLALSTWVSH